HAFNLGLDARLDHPAGPGIDRQLAGNEDKVAVDDGLAVMAARCRGQAGKAEFHAWRFVGSAGRTPDPSKIALSAEQSVSLPRFYATLILIPPCRNNLLNRP